MNPSMDPTFNVPQILARRAWLVLACSALGASIASFYALKSPNWYSARISVVPLEPAQGDQTSNTLPAGGDATLVAAQRIEAVLSSSSVADEVIEKFKLQDRYHVANLDTARAELARHCGASVDRRSNLITLTCEDQEPRVAMEMAAYFGEVGNRVFARVSASSVSEERKFLESQVETTRRDVDEASRKLRDFQRAHNIIDLPEQSKAVISAMAALKGELLSKQLELSYQASFSSDSEADLTQLRTQIRILAGKLHQLQTTAERSDFFPAAQSVPDLRFEFEQLVRTQKIHETLFLELTRRYETVKVEEARNTATFQILDHATLPANPSRPRRMKTALLGGFVGLVVACVLIVIPAWWRRHTDPSVA